MTTCQTITIDCDEEMKSTRKLLEGVSSTQVRTKVIRSFINHLVRYRAKLGVYLRLNGILTVRSISAPLLSRL